MKGWWKGTTVNQSKTSNELECGGKCCVNQDCKLWVWRKTDKTCFLKKDDNLEWTPDSNHFSATRKDGNT